MKPHRTTLAVVALLALAGCEKKKTKQPDPIGTTIEQPTLNLFGFEESYIHRINFNVQQRGRLILVHYDPKKPHEIAIVDCPMSTQYQYLESDGKGVETLLIRSMGELSAQIPMGLMRFGGYLKAGSELEFRYTTVGSYQVMDDPVLSTPAGECAKATHYVAALSVGAFSFVEHKGGEGGASAEVGKGPKVAVKAEHERGATRSWGDLAACDRDDPKGCRTPTQMLLMPLHVGEAPVTTTGTPREPPPTEDKPVDRKVVTLDIDEGSWRPGHYMGLALQKTLSFAQYFEEATTFGFDGSATAILGGYLDGEGLSIDRPLKAGVQYVVFATGSSEDDIDLGIMDAGGQPVALDNDNDAQPMVSFTPPQDGSYTILVAPGKADMEMFAAVGIMVDKGGYRVGPETLQGVYQSLLDRGHLASTQMAKAGAAKGLHFHAGQREWALLGTFLDPRTEVSLNGIHLAGPSVVISSAHHESCDLNVELRDPSGRKWSDTEADAVPVIIVEDPKVGAAHDLTLSYVKGEEPTLAATLILTTE